MKRTTIYLEPELEVLLKMEMLRTKQPMAGIVREAVLAYVTRAPREAPPGAGQFASGGADTAERAEAVLRETGFGEPPDPAARPRARRPARTGSAGQARRAPRTGPGASRRTRR